MNFSDYKNKLDVSDPDYGIECVKKYVRFCDDAKAELCITDNVKADLLIFTAYHFGCKDGYAVVFNYAEQMIDLLP